MLRRAKYSSVRRRNENDRPQQVQRLNSYNILSSSVGIRMYGDHPSAGVLKQRKHRQRECVHLTPPRITILLTSRLI